MDKHRIELIAAPLAVIIAIILVITTLTKVSPSRSRAVLSKAEEFSPGPREPVLSNISTGKTEIKKEAQKDIKSDIGKVSWGRDPFILDRASLFSPGMDQDKAAKVEQLSKLKLTGIIVSDENSKDSIAVINGENLKIGDMVSGFILKEVRQNSVILEWGNEDFELNLWEEESGKKQELIREQQ